MDRPGIWLEYRNGRQPETARRSAAVIGEVACARHATGRAANGDRYIVAANPTGAWVGKAGQIAARIESGWSFFVPKVGWTCFIEDESVLSAYKATGWSPGLAI